MLAVAVLVGVERRVEGQDDGAVELALEDLVQVGVGEEEELLAILVGEGEAVPTRELRAPGLEDLAILVVDDHVVARLVAEHEEPAVARLHHLVAVLDGDLGRVLHAPARDDLELVIAMADHVGIEPAAHGGGRQAGGAEAARGRAKKRASVHLSLLRPAGRSRRDRARR